MARSDFAKPFATRASDLCEADMISFERRMRIAMQAASCFSIRRSSTTGCEKRCITAMAVFTSPVGFRDGTCVWMHCQKAVPPLTGARACTDASASLAIEGNGFTRSGKIDNAACTTFNAQQHSRRSNGPWLPTDILQFCASNWRIISKPPLLQKPRVHWLSQA